MSAILYYLHDPMCSWCWGYRPTWEQLRSHLTESVTTQNVLGGLAPDTDLPMPDEMQQKLQAIWQQIHRQLGTQFNFDFWTENQPRRSTYPACRAVIAAGVQGREEAMILTIQQAYYQRALNPSDTAIHQQLAEELSLDVDRFMQDLQSPETEQTLQQQISMSRQWPIAGFPSLVLQLEGNVSPITLDYRDYRTSLREIKAKLEGGAV